MVLTKTRFKLQVLKCQGNLLFTFNLRCLSHTISLSIEHSLVPDSFLMKASVNDSAGFFCLFSGGVLRLRDARGVDFTAKIVTMLSDCYTKLIYNLHNSVVAIIERNYCKVYGYIKDSFATGNKFRSY